MDTDDNGVTIRIASERSLGDRASLAVLIGEFLSSLDTTYPEMRRWAKSSRDQAKGVIERHLMKCTTEAEYYAAEEAMDVHKTLPALLKFLGAEVIDND